MKTLKYILIAAICSFAFAACENMDWLHKEYLQNPSMHSAELPYVKVSAGFERVEIEWAHPVDQVSTGLRVRYGLGNNLEEIILSAEDVQNAIVGTWTDPNAGLSSTPGASGDENEEGTAGSGSTSGSEGSIDEEEEIVEAKEYPLCRYEITGLSKFNTYFFYVCSLDNYGNASLISETNAEIYTMQKLGGESLSNIARPKFYLYDNTKTDPSLTGHRLVIREFSGIINLGTAIEWKLKEGETVVAEGRYDRAEKDAEIENGDPEQTVNQNTVYWDRKYERTQFVEISDEWEAIEGLDNEKTYTIEYTYTFSPCVFMDKFGKGYYYQSVCVDSVDLFDNQDIKIEELGWKVEDPNSHPISKNLWIWYWYLGTNTEAMKPLYGETFWNELSKNVNQDLVKISYPEEDYPHLYENGKVMQPASFYQDPSAGQSNWDKHSLIRLSDDMLLVDSDTGRETYMDSYWRAAYAGEYPCSLIFSTGQDVMLNRIGMTFAREFSNIGTPGIYELWVSNDKEEEDGILDGWEKVGTFTQTIEAMGEFSYDDKYVDGVVWRLFEDANQMTKRCRHIRIRILEDLSNAATSIPAISEIFLYGIEGKELPPEKDPDDEGGEGSGDNTEGGEDAGDDTPTDDTTEGGENGGENTEGDATEGE